MRRREIHYTDAQRQQMMDWRRQIPGKHNESYRRTYDKAMSGKSLRAATRSKCLDCMGWDKKEVRNCDILSCSLWPHRPYQERVKSATERSPESNAETNGLFAASGGQVNG